MDIGSVIVFDIVRTVIFSGFLFLASWQDGRKKEVEIWIFWLGGLLGLAVCIWQTGNLLVSGSNGLKECLLVWSDCALGSLLGIGLLAGRRYIGNGIGAGDGLFFTVSGVILGLWKNVVLFWGATLLCGIWALFYSCWQQLHQKRWNRKETLPFLPFAALAWSGWLLMIWMEAG